MRILNIRIYLLLFIATIVTSVAASGSPCSGIDRTGYYAAFSAGSLESINSYINKLDNESNSSDNRALLGAMLMRKSGLLSNRREQLNIFKKGRLLLDKEIENAPNNAEYRFLRITIQEQAPKILGYNKQIEQDKKVLSKGYKDLSNDVQRAVASYAKKSHALRNVDLG